MSYLEELLSEFRKGAKIRRKSWVNYTQGISVEEGVKVLFNLDEINSDDWEIVKEPEVDWNYIIKNKCLCWFWDGVEHKRVPGVLTNKTEKRFMDQFVSYKKCRPVRKDEVTFYEDREK